MVYNRRRDYGFYSPDNRYGGGYSRDDDDIYESGYNSRAPRGYGNQTGFRYGRADRYGSYGSSRRATSGGYDTTGADYGYDTRYDRGAGSYDYDAAPRSRRDYSSAYTGSDYGSGGYYGDSSIYDEDDYDSNYGYTRGYRNRTFGNRYDADEDYGYSRTQDGYGRTRSNYGHSRYDPYGAYNTSYGNEYAAGNEDYDYDMRYGRSGMERDYSQRYGAPRYGRNTQEGNYGSTRYGRGYNNYASYGFGSPANDYEERTPRRWATGSY